MAKRLTDSERADLGTTIPGWSLEGELGAS